MEIKTLHPASHPADLLHLKKWPFFIFLVAVSVGFTLYINTFYSTEEIWINTYGEQLNLDRINHLMEASRRYRFVAYGFIPVIIILRICYNTLFVGAGNFMSDQGLHLTEVYNACLKAEIVFVLMTVTRLAFIEFIWNINNLQDLNATPLSLFQLFHRSQLPKWALQPLSYINVFELSYIFVLTGFISQYNNRKFWSNFRFALATYGAGLLLWCILLIYLTLIFS